MKNLLFIGMSLNVGGAEKSLVNLLNMIDYKKYNVDLLLFQKKGAFLKQVPCEVNIIEIPEISILFQSAKDSLKSYPLTFSLMKQVIRRYFYTLLCKIKWKQFDQMRLNRWINHYVDLIPANDQKYDVAIAYAGGECAYYMFDKVMADKKIYYFHSDYSKIDIDVELEKQYVDRADLIVTISEKCKNSLSILFPEISDRIRVLQNLSSKDFIYKLANEYYPKEFKNKEDYLKIVSVGRLISIKGFDLAVDAAHVLKNKGFKFVWTVVGDGEERENLEGQIKKLELEDCFKLVGLKENPYPYIKNANILLQTSRFEGKSVVLDEAKILNTPIIATNYNSVQDQVHHNIDGLVVGMNPRDIADGILRCNSGSILMWKEHIKIDEDIEDINSYMKCLLEE